MDQADEHQPPDPDRRDHRSPAERAGNADLSTVGTGSVVAIGCVLGLLMMILAGVVFFVLLRVL